MIRDAMMAALACLLAGAATGAPAEALVAAAKTQVGVTLHYDARYEKLSYPGGDVPIRRGVCTDVVVRAYRTLGVDLQQLVHQDMSQAWSAYPKLWQLKRPERNIDHRRVPNLATWFARHGQQLAVSRQARNYRPGDIVTWMVNVKLPHIGIVADQNSAAGVPLVIHNIGSGTKVEDVLFAYPITGHYRFNPAAVGAQARK